MVKHSKSRQGSGALVPAGKRIDHPENLKSRKQRELGAAFNRMSSDNDSEALSAFARARDITREIGTSFYAIWTLSRDNAGLQAINKKLGLQLKAALQENAKFRSMNLSYKLKGGLVRNMRILTRGCIALLPLVGVGILFQLGFISAAGGALLLLPIGFYRASRGVLVDSPHSIAFGIAVLLIGMIAIAVIADRDLPLVRRQEAAMLENMNRDHELGPKTLRIAYPISRQTRVATVLGIHDTITLTLQDNSGPIEIACAKYYDNAVIVPAAQAGQTPPPGKPDIFHVTPVATFGNCDLYAKLATLAGR